MNINKYLDDLSREDKHNFTTYEPQIPGYNDEVQERRWLPKCLQKVDGKITIKDKKNG